MRCPVDDSEAQAGLAQAIAEKYGRLDILVNNAGISKAVAHSDLDGLDDEIIDRIFRVNWRGAFASVRGAGAAADGWRWRRHHQYLIDCRAHGCGQQCRLLRKQGGDG